MNFVRRSALVLCFLIIFAATPHLKPAMAANPPTVLVTIKPIHSLLAAVSDGVFEPHLLLQGISSPHHFQLKPSAMKLIHQSDLVFWVGEGLETFLIKTLRGVTDKNKAQKLIDVAGLSLLALRERDFHDHLGNRQFHQSKQSLQRRYLDHHFWLDPVNASVLVGYFAKLLSAIDPGNAKIYQSNAVSAQGRLQLLTEDLQALLVPGRGKAYLVFHDSFQYFEARFNLTGAGVISIQPDGQPGAQRLRELQQLIDRKSVKCVFSEPQFQSRSVQMLVADTDVKQAIIDPLGSAQAAGATMYFDWLRHTAATINDCLSD